ncbi:L-xylulose reductase-like [Ruditapes philippinarum]|uniref:L-xylulose reductase-like n=1 Tax=Ruditapes philippinarum TaxID=129788 RepID=UPI00295ABA00|nr:L-xylulose reductase-like [Ruditapes philippinarum]
MSFDFSGKKVLVTGAGKGIGRAVAEKLSQCGCKVYVLSRTKSDLDSLVDDNQNITSIVADLCEWEETKTKLEKLEVLDGLVNNAGISGHEYAAVDCPREYIYKVLDTNLMSAINCSQIVAKKMIEAKVKGSIVNVSSIGSVGAFPKGLPYHMSKAALDMVSKQFALELGPHGIRVNSVNPSLVMTPMIREVIDKGIHVDEIITSRSSISRLLELHEIVNPILYLLSDLSTMVTGQAHVVDGGCLSNITTKA